MNLRTPYAFWLIRNGFVSSYPACPGDLEVDVAVVGAGITGALTAYKLAKEGLKTAILDRWHPGMGSTAASTALLQYEIDEPLHSLITKCGRDRAEKAYIACYEAIDELGRITREEKLEADFQKVPSFQYASFKKDVPELEKELHERRKLDFDVTMLGSNEILRKYGFTAPAGLLSSQGGLVDAYKLVHGLLSIPMDTLQIFDCTEVQEVEEQRGKVRLHLTGGGKVTAKHAVMACGYETLKFLPTSVANIGATYAFVSKPLPTEKLIPDSALLWETKDPYIYIRVTPDNRIMAGGRDDETNNPEKRDQALARKVKGLLTDLEKILPNTQLVPDYTWAGAFSSTKDSLGYVDSIPGKKRVFCNLGFGGNGILYSLIGADIIRDRIIDRKNDYDDVFAFAR